MTDRVMIDSTLIAHDPDMVPKTCDIIAPYYDGTYAVPSVAFVEKEFPGKRINGITVTGDNLNARTLDVERGDISATDLERIIGEWNAHDATRYAGGARPLVYCNRSTIPGVRTGTGKYVLGRDYYLWVATLDGSQYTGPGIIANQLWDYGRYDYSLVYDGRFLPS
jgi:hypothetical protein